MKKYIFSLFISLFTLCTSLSAQTAPTHLRIWQNGEPIYMDLISNIDSITFHTINISSILLNKTEVIMAVGKQERLVVRTDTGKAGKYSWTSSDKSVATIDQEGTVTAVAQGEAIITVTETTTNLTATCKVSVKSEWEAISFTKATVNCYLGDEDLAKCDTVDSVFSATVDGKKVALRAIFIDARVDLYSDGLYLNDDEVMDGASEGYVVSFPAKAYYAVEGLNDDRGFKGAGTVTDGAWSTGYAANKSHYMVSGAFNKEREPEAIEKVKAALTYLNEKNHEMYYQNMIWVDTVMFAGARATKYTFNTYTNQYSHAYFPKAIPTAAAFYLESGSNYKYMYNVTACDMYLTPMGGNDIINGLMIDVNEITYEYTLNSESFIFEPVVHYKHTSDNAPLRLAPEQQARPKMLPLSTDNKTQPIILTQPKKINYKTK